MIVHTMQSRLAGAKAEAFFGFMINPTPEVYAKWLPEEHYEFHLIKKGKDEPVGNLFYFDQNIGKKFRMKFCATIVVAEQPEKIVFQMRKFGINLPGFLELEFEDTQGGLALTERIRIGFRGVGRVFDPFIRIIYSERFFKEMDAHHEREWVSLAECLAWEVPRTYKIREITPADYPQLEDFLYHAIFIPEGEEYPAREIIFQPEIYVYIKEFGGKDDCGVVAEIEGRIVGAAWTRIIPAYGNIDESTPELAISVLPEFRGREIGTDLMNDLFELLRKRGYARTSLSVQQNNPAARLYRRLGYVITDEKKDHAGHDDYIMVKDL